MAYAAVISLKRTIERLTNQTMIAKAIMYELNLFDRAFARFDYCNKVNYSGVQRPDIDKKAIDELDAAIRDEAWKLEDVIDSYLLSLSQSQLGDNGDKGLEQEMHSFLERVKKLKDEYKGELEDNKPAKSSSSSSAAAAAAAEEEEEEEVIGGNKSTETVGLSDQLEEIMSGVLLDDKHGVNCVSLLGMAGIGKTHLAREIYQHPTIVQHFDCRAWVKIGPRYCVRNFLDDLRKQGDDFAAVKYLQDGLPGRRCLIVLDDVWSSEMGYYFIGPCLGNGIKFILTSRLEEATKYSCTILHHMRLMSNEESWDLLRQFVFLDDKSSFSPQLEKPGRKIAAICEGLPLLILAVAEILAGFEKTYEYWMKVANKKTTTFVDAYEKISKVLFSSYDYLPQRLRPCFLYMGVFPQSCEISVPKLINLSTVEDFLESRTSPILEDFSMECLKKLISCSLVILCKRSCNVLNKITSCKLHSAYWYLCVKEARRIKFLHVLNKLSDCSTENVVLQSQRRLSFQNNVLFGIKEVQDVMADTQLTARSLLCMGEDHEYPVPICVKNLMLLRVLDALALRFYEFPEEEVVKLLLLKYLAITHSGKLPSSISNLQSLEFLIVQQYHNVVVLRDPICLPTEIWDLQELSYLRIVGSNLPGPTYPARLHSLNTLHINAHSCTKDVLEAIPSYLRKLGIKIELQPNVVAAEPLGCFQHIRLLDELSELKCAVVNPQLGSHQDQAHDHLSNLPKSLTKLSLTGLGYSWKYISAIASLPELQVLKFRFYAFQGVEWDVKVGEFHGLQCLLLEDLDLVKWTIEDGCFPELHSLIIRNCYKLKEIPQQIGAVPNLYSIEIVDCSPSVVACAQECAQKIQQGKDFLVQLIIDTSWNL